MVEMTEEASATGEEEDGRIQRVSRQVGQDNKPEQGPGDWLHVSR